MKFKNSSFAFILATLPTTGILAAALDRSGQSISAFLQPNNYFETSISVIDPNISGKSKDQYPFPNSPISNTDVGEMANQYYFVNAALKIQLNDSFSLGLIYDQPFGAKATYSTGTRALPVILPPSAATLAGHGTFHNGNEGTKAEVNTQNLAFLLGYQPNKSFNFYAGTVYQTVKGNIRLRGTAYGGNATIGGYDANIKENEDIGWLFGGAYIVPEIGLKASITYRSEIKHSVNATEKFNARGLFSNLNMIPQENTNITTPQSLNIDFQSGIMKNTIAFTNFRWVNWKDFTIQPYKFGIASKDVRLQAQTGKSEFDLVAYTKDQYSITTGIGYKLNDEWGSNISIGWDSGAGNPVTTLGPTEGYWNLGIGLQYSPASSYFISGGIKYFWLGDAKAQSGSQFDTSDYVANFTDNHSIAYGLKIGYKF